MIAWYVVFPVAASLLLLLLFGVAIYRSSGFREFCLGLTGNAGKFSLLNIMSVEGVGTIVVVGILMGGGVVYPLSTIKPALTADEQKKLEQDLKAAKEKIAQLENPKVWTIDVNLKLPQGWVEKTATDDPRIGEIFKDGVLAQDFWSGGTWTLLPSERTTVKPGKVTLSRQSGYKQANAQITVLVPAGMKLSDWIGEIKYENPRYDLEAELLFDSEKKEYQTNEGPRSIRYSPLVLTSMSSSFGSREQDSQ